MLPLTYLEVKRAVAQEMSTSFSQLYRTFFAANEAKMLRHTIVSDWEWITTAIFQSWNGTKKQRV